MQEQIEKVFRPEFLNRVDDIIVFRHLTQDDLGDVIEMELRKVRERLSERGMKLVLTRRGEDVPHQEGEQPRFRRRPLRRAIENFVEDPLSEELLKGEFKGMDTITIEVKEVAEKKQLFFHGTRAMHRPNRHGRRRRLRARQRRNAVTAANVDSASRRRPLAASPARRCWATTLAILGRRAAGRWTAFSIGTEPISDGRLARGVIVDRRLSPGFV